MSWILVFFAWTCLFHVGLTTYVFLVIRQRGSASLDDPFMNYACKVLLYGGKALFFIAALFTYELYVEGLAENGLIAASGGTPLQYTALGGLLVYTLFTVPSAFYLRVLEHKKEPAVQEAS